MIKFKDSTIKPFLKWPGNKYQCLQYILQELPEAHRLIEPFTGSGAIFLNTHYQTYLLAEANQDLISLYQYIQTEHHAFIHYCEEFFKPNNNQEERYYELRAQFNQMPYSRKRAAIFLYLNRHGYNGLCRYNQSGVYNVPFGCYKAPYFPRKELEYFHTKSQQATFQHADFEHTISNAQPGDLIYCDPPYSPIAQQSNFSAYTPKKFGPHEHERLAQLAHQASQRGIIVIISNHDTEITRTYYQKARIKSFSAKRFINCKATQRTPTKELLAIFG